jgi:hypothetical protein
VQCSHRVMNRRDVLFDEAARSENVRLPFVNSRGCLHRNAHDSPPVYIHKNIHRPESFSTGQRCRKVEQRLDVDLIQYLRVFPHCPHLKAKYQHGVRLFWLHRVRRLSIGIGREAFIAEDTFPLLAGWLARTVRVWSRRRSRNENVPASAHCVNLDTPVN